MPADDPEQLRHEALDAIAADLAEAIADEFDVSRDDLTPSVREILETQLRRKELH